MTYLPRRRGLMGLGATATVGGSLQNTTQSYDCDAGNCTQAQLAANAALASQAAATQSTITSILAGLWGVSPNCPSGYLQKTSFDGQNIECVDYSAGNVVSSTPVAVANNPLVQASQSISATVGFSVPPILLLAGLGAGAYFLFRKKRSS